MIEIKENSDGIDLKVRVIPRSSRTMIVGEHDGALKVKISSPPVDGAANDEIIKLMAKTLGVSRSRVEIVSGQTAKAKQIRISDVTAEQAKNALGL